MNVLEITDGKTVEFRELSLRECNHPQVFRVYQNCKLMPPLQSQTIFHVDQDGQYWRDGVDITDDDKALAQCLKDFVAMYRIKP